MKKFLYWWGKPFEKKNWVTSHFKYVNMFCKKLFLPKLDRIEQLTWVSSIIFFVYTF